MGTTGWIVLIYLVISGLGSLMSRQAQKSRERARGQRSRRKEEPTGASPWDDPSPAPAPAARRQTPEEIAAEIRRVMGLEREEQEVEVIEEVYEEPVYSTPAEPAYTFDPESQRRGHGGDLHDRIHEREVEGHHGPGNLESRHLGSRHLESHRETLAERMEGRALGTLRSRYAAAPAPTPLRKSVAFAGSSYIDITSLARALVTAEVLGPPKAFRDEW